MLESYGPVLNRSKAWECKSSTKAYYTFNALSSGIILSSPHWHGMVPACNMPLLSTGCRRGPAWHWSGPEREVGRERNLLVTVSSGGTTRERVLVTKEAEKRGKRELWHTTTEMTTFPLPNRRQLDPPQERWGTCQWNPFTGGYCE